MNDPIGQGTVLVRAAVFQRKEAIFGGTEDGDLPRALGVGETILLPRGQIQRGIDTMKKNESQN